MATDTALRFAQTSLSLYRHERTFSIGVGEEDALDPIARAFEYLGCTVTEKDPVRLILTVACDDGWESEVPASSNPVKRQAQGDPVWSVPELGDTRVLAAHVRAVAREAIDRARETRQRSRAAAAQFAKDREIRKQDRI